MTAERLSNVPIAEPYDFEDEICGRWFVCHALAQSNLIT